MGPPKFNPIRDVLSGAIMAATSVPQLIAYAETVGVEGYRGLTTAGVPLLTWGLATGSPWMNSGVTSLSAVMAKTDLRGESYAYKFGMDEYVDLISVYSLYVGLASIGMALLGFATLAKRVPVAVKVGFKWGCETGVLLSALPNGLYSLGNTSLRSLVSSNPSAVALKKLVKSKLPMASGFPNVLHVSYALSHPLSWDAESVLLFGSCAAFILVARRKLLPAWMPPGSEVVIATALATWYSVQTGYSGGVVGEIPTTTNHGGGLELLGLRIPVQTVDLPQLLRTVPIAQRCFDGSHLKLLLSACIFSGINFLSIVGIASGFESDNNVPWSPRRELLAQGLSNLAGGFIGSAPSSGSMSRSLVSRMTGATSQLACITTALLWIYMMPYMKIMSNTPKAALSAVIFSAVVKNVLLPKKIYQLQGTHFATAVCTGLVSILMSPTVGFAFGLLFYFALNTLLPTIQPPKKKVT